ncbi:MAG: ribonuclease Z [Candidatus Microthrix subdominans]|uniref:ribonuclease Z n=1 Tax=Candidatus Neomicrothrix sp. TaxID=2719034 RepID=UPI00259867CC|nr:ribonuclease Z [Candidatus Microthrix sp.]HMS48766.1 ribonuclease Z [Candidatus Microthrix sp.]
MRLLPLGTAAGRPTRDRFTSSTLLDVPAPTESAVRVLIDCGEAAQNRLLSVGVSPTSLDAICCTHLHGDHVLGLPGLLATMGMDDRQRPLRLIGPTGLSDLLDALAATPALRIAIPLDIEEFDPARLPDTDVTRLAPIDHLGVAIAPLDHRVPTIGFRFDASDAPGNLDLDRLAELGVPRGPLLGALQRGEAVITPSGRTVEPSEVTGPATAGASAAFAYDTRPCDGARALATGVGLLVHEATFAQADADLADRHGHATASEAAGVARDAGATALLLTHFSMRYDSTDGLLEEAQSVFPATELAQELVWNNVPQPG